MKEIVAVAIGRALLIAVAALLTDRSISNVQIGQRLKPNLKFATVCLLGTALLVINASTTSVEAAEGQPVLTQIASIDLPGPSGKRFDYLVIDYDSGLLFSTHLAANQTYVIDLKSNAVLQTISDTPGAEGIEYVPKEGKIYTSNAGDDTVGVIDLKTMRVIRKIPTERKPDGSTYAAIAHKLYVSDERAKAVAVIDVRTDEILTTRTSIVKRACQYTT
jgi:YVTN family beta-propeller protein